MCRCAIQWKNYKRCALATFDDTLSARAGNGVNQPVTLASVDSALLDHERNINTCLMMNDTHASGGLAALLGATMPNLSEFIGRHHAVCAIDQHFSRLA